MMRKAFLVGFAPLVRVIADVPDNFEPVHDHGIAKTIIDQAREQILRDAAEKLSVENCDRLEEDTECPYDEASDRKHLSAKDRIADIIRRSGEDGILDLSENEDCDISLAFDYEVFGSISADDFNLTKVKLLPRSGGGFTVTFTWEGCNSCTAMEKDIAETQEADLEYIIDELETLFPAKD